MTNLKLSESEKRIVRGLLARNTRELPNGCLIWEAGGASHGYGILWTGLRQLTAHKAVIGLNFAIPEGAVVRHLCNNKRCVKEEHLKLGTYKENGADETLRLLEEYKPLIAVALQHHRAGLNLSNSCFMAGLPYTTFTRRILREACC